MFVGCWVLDERGEERPVGLWTVAPRVKHPWTRVRLWTVVCVPGAPHHPSQQHGSICEVFSFSLITSIFGCMYEALNVGKKNN